MINTMFLNKRLESIEGVLRDVLAQSDVDSVDKLREATRQVAAQCRELNERRERVKLSIDFTPIDADFEIRNGLERARIGIRLMHQQLSRAPVSKSTIFTSLRRALEAVYTAANELQWEIGEHDASCYSRKPPVLVSNQDELDRALNSIRAEE